MADNLLDFGDDDDLFGGSYPQGQLNKSTSRSLDDILGLDANADISAEDGLDDILTAETVDEDELFKTPKKVKKKAVKQTEKNLFGECEDELDIFSPVKSEEPIQVKKERANTASSDDDFLDSLLNYPSNKPDTKPRTGSFLDDFDDLLQPSSTNTTQVAITDDTANNLFDETDVKSMQTDSNADDTDIFKSTGESTIEVTSGVAIEIKQQDDEIKKQQPSNELSFDNQETGKEKLNAEKTKSQNPNSAESATPETDITTASGTNQAGTLAAIVDSPSKTPESLDSLLLVNQANLDSPTQLPNDPDLASPDSLDALLDAQPVDPVTKPVKRSNSKLRRKPSKRISSAAAKPSVKLDDIKQDSAVDSLDVLLDSQKGVDSSIAVTDDLDALLEINKSELTQPGSIDDPSDLNKPADDLDALVDTSLKEGGRAREEVDILTESSVNTVTGTPIFNTQSKDEDLHKESPTDLSDREEGDWVEVTKETDESPGTSPDPVEEIEESSPEPQSETPEPVEEFEEVEVEPFAERQDLVKDPKKPKQKRAMERSFEDLLHGLSDESEPELDDMILGDDLDNTNLESILVSPNKSVGGFGGTSPATEQSKKMDTKTSTPKTDSYDLRSRAKVTPPEVIVYNPEEEEEEEKDYFARDKEMEDVSNNQGNSREEDEEDDDDNEIGYKYESKRGRTTSKTDSNDDDIDLSAISDTNHLNVNVSKHKSTLSKKGSLARRKSQTRKGRKSLLSGGEDAIFQDSTEPRPTKVMNGEGDDDMRPDPFDMSPPAKKPSPSNMVPLPGMAARSPKHRSTSGSTLDRDPSPAETKRVSKPPPGAFRLPGLPNLADKPKPLARTPKPAARETSPVPFDRAGLKSVSTPSTSKEPESERDVMFEKPALRHTSRPGREDKEEKMDTGVFAKPTLRSTPKPKRDVDLATVDSKPQTEEPKSTENIFNTPLRPTGRKLVPSTDEPVIVKDENMNANMFEKPRLRSTRQDLQSSSTASKDTTPSHVFNKPVLRNTPPVQRGDNLSSKISEDSPSSVFDRPALKKAESTDHEMRDSSEPKGMFEKPALRTTPSPEKEVKSEIGPKGTFSRPSLRRTDKGKVPDEKVKAAEKPEWLQTAAVKGSKALNVLQSKENKNTSEKPVPSWLEKDPLRKGQPLQDSSNGQSETRDRAPSNTSSRSREPSIGSDMEVDRKRSGSSASGNKEAHNNYAPSWVRQTRATSLTPGSGPSTPTTDTEEMPSWQRELAQRRLKRKEQSPMDQPRKEESSEPEWKKNMLRKVRPVATPTRETHSVEPEWKKAAEEKHARLRSKSLQFNKLSFT